MSRAPRKWTEEEDAILRREALLQSTSPFLCYTLSYVSPLHVVPAVFLATPVPERTFLKRCYIVVLSTSSDSEAVLPLASDCS